MKLLFVIDSLGSGGAQRQMVSLALGLTNRGHHVEFFVYQAALNHFKALIDEAGIITHSVQKKHRFSISPFIALRKILINSRFDGILAFLSTPSFYSEIARIGLNRKMFLVVSERSVFTNFTLSHSSRLLQQFHRLADRVTVNSFTQKRNMEAIFPWMKSLLRVIYNGVNLNTFKPFLMITSYERIRFLAVGTVNRNKNPTGLVEALCRLIDKIGNNCEIHWAGKIGTSKDAIDEWQKANELINSCDLANSWKWLGEVSNMANLIPQYDVLIHPSFFEGLPNAVCEAMACGKPVLASNVCDNPFLVHNGENGYLFDPADPASIALAMENFFVNSREIRLKMGLKSRQLAEELLALEKLVDSYESLFVELLKT